MTDFISSIVVDEVIDALATVVNLFLQGGIAIRGQVNRVPSPPTAGTNFAELTEILQVDLTTPYQTYDDPLTGVGTLILNGSKRIDVQVDIYGENAGEMCSAVKTALRTDWGFLQFPENIKPLYTNDGNQSPLIDGEQQYVSRWTLTVSMQYNPIVTVPQEFADEATVKSTQPVDIFETIT